VKNPDALAGATGPVETVKRAADGVQDSRKSLKNQEATIVFEGLGGPVAIRLTGHLLSTLRQLVVAGAYGVTPLERPAPGWSHCVDDLRALGFAIDTIHEEHGDDKSGRHSRYALRTVVAIGGGAS
jgi:hypothetical protein